MHCNSDRLGGSRRASSSEKSGDGSCASERLCCDPCIADTMDVKTIPTAGHAPEILDRFDLRLKELSDVATETQNQVMPDPDSDYAGLKVEIRNIRMAMSDLYTILGSSNQSAKESQILLMKQRIKALQTERDQMHEFMMLLTEQARYQQNSETNKSGASTVDELGEIALKFHSLYPAPDSSSPTPAQSKTSAPDQHSEHTLDLEIDEILLA